MKSRKSMNHSQQNSGSMERKYYKYHGQQVYLEKKTYRNNGSIAILMYNMDDEPYGAVTVNLCHPIQSDELAFVDENNMPGIGKWLERNHIALSMCLNARSGFCEYPLYMFTI